MHPHLPVVNFCTVIRSEEQRALHRSCIRRQWKTRSEKFLSERKKLQCHRKIRMYGIGKHRADVSRPVRHHNPEAVSVLLIWALCCLIVNATVVYSYYTFTFRNHCHKFSNMHPSNFYLESAFSAASSPSYPYAFTSASIVRSARLFPSFFSSLINCQYVCRVLSE